MFLHSFYTPGLSIYSYLIGDNDSKRAIIIDPTRNVETYLKYSQQQGFKITDIAETHIHADFISGAKELKYQLKGKPSIHCSALGGPKWIPHYADRRVMNRDEIKLGHVRLQALHTPGHTPEHIIWLCYDDTRSQQTPCLALTGDFLFVGSMGRPDLLGEEEREKLTLQLYHSAFVALDLLPDFLEIFPAHGAGSLCGKGLSIRSSSTLGYERLFNPFLIKQPIEKWTTEIQKQNLSFPINFQRIKKMNIEGPPLLSESNNKEEKILIIDVRSPETFAQAHIEGSINIPFGPNFCNWLGSILSENRFLQLVVETTEQFAEVKKNLNLIGFDDVQPLIWNKKQIQKQFRIQDLSMINVDKLAELIQHAIPSIYILDVRTPTEWKTGHIKEAHHLELTQLTEKISQIPKDTFIFAICGSGYRSSIAASLLKKEGYTNVAHIRGGMTAWNQAKRPINL